MNKLKSNTTKSLTSLISLILLTSSSHAAIDGFGKSTTYWNDRAYSIQIAIANAKTVARNRCLDLNGWTTGKYQVLNTGACKRRQNSAGTISYKCTATVRMVCKAR